VGKRLDITFASGDGECAAWLYPGPSGSGDGAGAPCLVMAHGFGACKEGRLDAFAEHFEAAGFAALVFDYRHFGGSSGEPRQLIDIGRQHADWQAAIAHARALAGVDPGRIALWGSSFSGGHVIWAAARDERIAAVVAQVPHTSGPATLKMTGPRRGAWMTQAALRDQFASIRGGVHEMPIVGPAGSMASMTTDDAGNKYAEMYPPDFDFHNGIPARIMLQFGLYSPGRDAGKVRCPLLVIIGEKDTITPPEPARRAAERAPKGELLSFAGAHFDIYRDDDFEWAVEREAEFLRRAVPA
jgi:fermentation-respiration switch protein FrsA (DUF1100 family)